MQKIELKLTKIDLRNLNELIEISRITYKDSFSNDNTPENMESYLSTSFNKNKLKKELMDNNSEFYFSKFKDETSGYLKVNLGDSQTDIKDGNGMELERIYVLEKFQGKKIGQFLINRAIRIAEKRNVEYIWLGVWEKNSKAIAFYKKNGFKIVGTHLFKMGNDIQTDYIMKRKI
ncbi:GNAT family N-acetyltransferase [Aurantibacter sp.]|uniref:GNAT family N-acetyltransferase n=1 Tax=Aurantibacter sp. TaxID=2807103 RepID=UPI0032646633